LFILLTSVIRVAAQDDSIAYYLNNPSDFHISRAEALLPSITSNDSARIAKLGIQIRKKENRVKFYDLLGDRFYDVDDYDHARQYYGRALEVAKLSLDKELIADELASVGDMYRLQDQNTIALSYLFQAMYLYKEKGNQERLAHVLGLIGDVHRCVEQYDDALTYLHEGLMIAEKTGNVKDQAFCYSSIGGTYQSMGKFNEAFANYTKGLSLAGVNDTMRSVDFLYSIGDLLVEMGRTQEALNYLQRGVELSTITNDLYHLAFCHLGMARAYLADGNSGRSIEEALICYDIGVDLNAYGFCAEASGVLYEAYALKKDYLNAYKYLKYVKDNDDSTMNSAQIKQQAQIELNFKNSYKEKQDSLERIAVQQQRDVEYNSQLQRQKILTISVVSGLAVVLIIALIMYRNYIKERRSRQIIDSQKALVDIKNKEILDSINYARKIQQAIIPTHTELKNVFHESFVLLLPKDIVSGDFYWVVKSGQQAFFAVADCTGHGVPGGFMSMLGTALLNEIINEKRIYDPADILDMLKLKIILALRQTENTNENRDGMDIALFRLDYNTMELTFAGANNALYLLRDEKLTELKGNKFPVGFTVGNHTQFSQQKITLRKNDCLYMFTDGYPDQFGGPQGKKFKYKRLEELLQEIGGLPMEEQRKKLLQTFEDWKGDLEQVDDICIAGIRI
jgi:serine phosphatase RsbU (regulator of sigma subunit)